MARLEVFTLPGLPEVRPGDDLAALVWAALSANGMALQDGDVVALAQKIVSKAENRFVSLRAVQPSAEALKYATDTGKDARLVEVMLRESRTVLRTRPNLMIVEDRRGLVLANAGIDASNVPGSIDETVLLLPADPDASAARLRQDLQRRGGRKLAVIILDSIGRAWRQGTVGTAIGCAGLPALKDLRGRPDREGRTLMATEIGLADEISAAASLLIGQADEGTPVAIVRGLPYELGEGRASDIQRPRDMDLFR